MSPADFVVRRLESGQEQLAAPLFAAYRHFYGKAYDEPEARSWLAARLERDESVVLVAQSAEVQALGFVQLYRGFSSIALCPAWVLNDLFVVPEGRGQGVAERLVAHAEHAARDAGCRTLTLETGRDNHGAQRLYRRLGWTEETDYLTFHKALDE